MTACANGCNFAYHQAGNLSKMNQAKLIRSSTLVIGVTFVAFFIVFIPCGAIVDATEKDHIGCSLTASLQLSRQQLNVTYINADANVFFTVLMPPLECRSDSLQRRDTLIYLNAVNFALDLLNAVPHVDGHSSIAKYLPLLQLSQPWPERIKYGAKVVTVQTPINGESSPVSMVCSLQSI